MRVLRSVARLRKRPDQLTLFQTVKKLRAADMPASRIVRETGIGRRRVAVWKRIPELPERSQMEPREGMPAFYRDYLWRRWTDGCQQGTDLLAEIRAVGYAGLLLGIGEAVGGVAGRGAGPDALSAAARNG